MDYRKILESRYDRKDWQELLYDIFRQKVQFWQQPQQVPVDKTTAKQALYMGKITLSDGHILAVYEVELSDNVSIKRNRAGIRNLLCSNWKGMGCVGAFMFCFRKNEAVLRFSYVSEAFAFAEDGSLKKESTDTKRFTYLLGKGHRSRTAIKQFEELKKSSLDLKAITKAFSVEALSDAFFNEYKKQYEDIVEFITGKRMVKVSNKWEEKVIGTPCKELMQEFCKFPDPEKAVRDYVKKLMGRLVFIQFLQKKGWMGCPAGEAWNGGDKEFVQNLFAKATNKDTFVDDVLEPLFNDINTKRAGDLTSCPNVGTNIKIPYLNGGLFEKDNHDNISFPLPKKFMQNMLDFFASYNFTIDENDPDDAEIGVDPEMLGRIFENMLEDNKDKGAFYTPKEIVQYMCRESLIAYLQTDITDETIKESIRQFVTTHDATTLSNNLKAVIDQKLKDVKICDPAIGSGAFPMGLLHELYACRKPLEGLDDETAANIKAHIIQNNIYGVDIENGAVEIARLRFWLALIVDEKTPHALPNLDFKIMQGNSLLEQYEGVDLSGLSVNEQEKKKSRAKKQDAWQPTFAFDEQDSLNNIQHAMGEYYRTDNYARKIELREIIDKNVKSYIVNLKGCTPEIKEKIKNLQIPNNQFFLWHIYFKEVFDKGGFDIVIGNPPYIGVKGHREIFDKIKPSYLGQYFIGKMDYFYFFFHLSLSILKKSGVGNFITTNYYITADGASKLRKHLHIDSEFIDLFNLGEMKLFENAPGQHNMISMYRKGKCKNIVNKCTIRDVHRNGTLSSSLFVDIIQGKDPLTKYTIKTQDDLFDGSECYIRLSENVTVGLNSILAKIANNNKTLREICDINQGIVSGADYVSEKHLSQYTIPCSKRDGIFVLDENNLRDSQILSRISGAYEERRLVKTFFKNSDIYKYTTSEVSSKRILFMGKDISSESHLLANYPIIGNHLLDFKQILVDKRKSLNEKTEQWFTLNRGTSHPDVFCRPKIVCPQRSKSNTFGYNESEWYAASDVFYITNPEVGYDIKYILGVLNSKLYFTWLYNKGKRKGETLELTATPLSEIPIKMPTEHHSIAIVKKIDEILSQKQSGLLYDTSFLEHEIDLLVYDLYGLTKEERLIVDPEYKE